jgi:hypothetical protein
VALVTTQEVKDWVAGDGTTTITGVNDTVLTACIAAAGETIIEESARIWEKGAVSEVLDGSAADGSCGEILLLRRFPVTYPADPITVTENGVALVVAQGYAPTAGVIVKGAGLEDCCRLIRHNASPYGLGGWAPGIQNISVSYQAGFTVVPDRIKYVAKEFSWLLYQEGRKVGVDHVAQAGNARTLVHKLSDLSRGILARARRW